MAKYKKVVRSKRHIPEERSLNHATLKNRRLKISPAFVSPYSTSSKGCRSKVFHHFEIAYQVLSTEIDRFNCQNPFFQFEF
jgi:hypothetical protein